MDSPWFVRYRCVRYRFIRYRFKFFRYRYSQIFKTSSRRRQVAFTRRPQDVFLRRFQDVFKTSWKKKTCYAEDFLKTSWRHVVKTSSRRLQDQQMFAGNWSNRIINVVKCRSFGIKNVNSIAEQIQPKLYLNNEYVKPVKTSESFLYLGRYFDFEMSSNNHKHSKWVLKITKHSKHLN